MFRLILISLLFFPACNQSSERPPAQKEQTAVAGDVPAANTVVASDSIRLPDALNEMYFSIEIVATPHSANGVYEVLVSYGHNDASTQVTMPAADRPLVPELRRGREPFSYIIGFHFGSDTTFNEYFVIKAQRGKTEMKYLKAYSFK